MASIVVHTRALIDGDATNVVDVLDRALMYGDGVFRTMSWREGRARSWARHYRKLAEDCGALRIECPEESLLRSDVARACAETPRAAVKIVVTRGSGARGYSPVQGRARRIILVFPQPDASPVSFEVGVRVRWCELRLAAQPKLAGIKHLNRLENVLARGEWDDLEVIEGLLRDQCGNVIGGTMTNLFIEESGALVTPNLSQCGVAGVQRARMLDAARKHGVSARIEDIAPGRLLAADAVLLVNSLIGCWRVGTIEDRAWMHHPRLDRYAQWLEAND